MPISADPSAGRIQAAASRPASAAAANSETGSTDVTGSTVDTIVVSAAIAGAASRSTSRSSERDPREVSNGHRRYPPLIRTTRRSSDAAGELVPRLRQGDLADPCLAHPDAPEEHRAQRRIGILKPTCVVRQEPPGDHLV